MNLRKISPLVLSLAGVLGAAGSAQAATLSTSVGDFDSSGRAPIIHTGTADGQSIINSYPLRGGATCPATQLDFQQLYPSAYGVDQHSILAPGPFRFAGLTEAEAPTAPRSLMCSYLTSGPETVAASSAVVEHKAPPAGCAAEAALTARVGSGGRSVHTAYVGVKKCVGPLQPSPFSVAVTFRVTELTRKKFRLPSRTLYKGTGSGSFGVRKQLPLGTAMNAALNRRKAIPRRSKLLVTVTMVFSRPVSETVSGSFVATDGTATFPYFGTRSPAQLETANAPATAGGDGPSTGGKTKG